jgi:hypothetical protein
MGGIGGVARLQKGETAFCSATFPGTGSGYQSPESFFLQENIHLIVHYFNLRREISNVGERFQTFLSIKMGVYGMFRE